MYKRNILISEAATILGIPVKKIYRLVHTQNFTYLKVGWNKFILVDDLMDWLYKKQPHTYCNR